MISLTNSWWYGRVFSHNKKARNQLPTSANNLTKRRSTTHSMQEVPKSHLSQLPTISARSSEIIRARDPPWNLETPSLKRPWNHWLVGGFNPEKYDFVSWDDDLPNLGEIQSHVPNHQPAGVAILLRSASICLDLLPQRSPKVLHLEETSLRWVHWPVICSSVVFDLRKEDLKISDFCCLWSCPHLGFNESTLWVLVVGRLFPLGMHHVH